MKNRDTFSGYHPLVNFLYFALVLVFGMCFMHPACLVISLGSATAYSLYLKGRKGLRFSLRFLLPMMVLAAVLNPAFNHEGVTILAYTPNDNPITLESIIYGLASAFMLVSVVQWFSCYNEVMTSDKFVYLFGRIIPALSLVLSMTLRFVPRFTAQLKTVRTAQQCIGRDVSDGSIIQRMKHGITIFSILVTWSLENAIETADSMKSRGYGLPGRSAFSIYRFDSRDKAALLWLGFCCWYILFGWIGGALTFRYYPSIRGAGFGPFPFSFFLVYLALCLTPLILNGREDMKWKRLRSGT
ncbi:MAG: energy-coupling factor transporter transmembrane protein EcfT [Oscillospiraceae bacterium]|nr:energy-coupling factor transporter transmembrane protein EcfT [Oscillospiraceae bacterium]